MNKSPAFHESYPPPWCNNPSGASRSHSDTPHPIWLLWTSDQSYSETVTWQHTTLTTDRHPCPRRDSNPQFQQVSNRRPTDGAATGIGLETYYPINYDPPLEPTRANWIKFTILNPTYSKCSTIFSSHLHLRPPSCFGASAFCGWICMTNISYACFPSMLHVPHFPVFSSFAYKLGSDSSDVTNEQNKIWSQMHSPASDIT